MVVTMRMTISLDDQLARQVRREAAAQGRSVSAFVAGVLSDALGPQEPPPFHLLTVRGSRPRPGFDLDRPRDPDAEEDEWTLTGQGPA